MHLYQTKSILRILVLIVFYQNSYSQAIKVEAEHFFRQSKDEVRKWHVIKESEINEDEASSHTSTASGSSYVKILPDTRVTHDDKLIHSENFSNVAGEMSILHYKVNIPKAGKYYVWARAYSSGSEDNGIHVGLNGDWPVSGQRMQWCEGKNKWTWESKQRTANVHCGEPYLIYLEIDKPGEHEITFSMREDGFEFDAFILATDKDYQPELTP